MRSPRSSGLREFGFGLALVLLNALVVLQVTGVAYQPFSWQAFAQVYENLGEPPTGDPVADPDSDAIKGSERDPRGNIFDASGCFFDMGSGAIVPGGMVAETCAACAGSESNIPKGGDPMDGSMGCFAFKYTNPRVVTFQFTFTLPPNCVLAADCPDQGSFASSSSSVTAPAAVSIGNAPNSSMTQLPTACTPWYSQVTLDLLDDSEVPSAVINNNVPLDCCGNGFVSGDEACDDGNTVGGDGCSADCQAIELGFECPTPGSPCSAICGDGLIVDGETCDDGNTQDGDCCTSTCQFDVDTCPAAPAPALGPTALAAAVCVLAIVSFLAMLRQRRTSRRDN